MIPISKSEADPVELNVALGLVWGYLKVGQFEQGHALVRGCMQVWPNDIRFQALAAYAAAETGHALDAKTVSMLKTHANEDWALLVLRRAGML